MIKINNIFSCISFNCRKINFFSNTHIGNRIDKTSSLISPLSEKKSRATTVTESVSTRINYIFLCSETTSREAIDCQSFYQIVRNFLARDSSKVIILSPSVPPSFMISMFESPPRLFLSLSLVLFLFFFFYSYCEVHVLSLHCIHLMTRFTSGEVHFA